MPPITAPPHSVHWWILTLLCGALTGCAVADAPLRVGCYYFPGWFNADRWVPIVEYGGRDPVIGHYRDASPEVQDWHIRQATQHGISFWVFDWYCHYRNGPEEHHNVALDQGFLHASLRERMDFALMWCNEESGTPEYTEEDMLQLVATLGERYLSQPNYLRAPDGRGILVISRPDRIIDRFGVEGTREMLATMSNAAAPWGGLFFACIQAPVAPVLERLRDAGFDAVTRYSYADEGMEPGAREAPYSAIREAIEPLWRQAAREPILPLIPSVSPGWDSRPWYGDRALVRTGSSPEEFGRMCEALKPCIDPDLGLLVIGTWNEFGEGTYVEPTWQRGCSMLDAMQKAVFGVDEPHEVLAPTEDELSRLTYPYVPAHMEEQIARQGGNLIINPGFEVDWGWVYYDDSAVVYSSEVAHTGSRSVLVTREHGGIKNIRLAPGVAWPHRANNHVPVESGRGYRVGAWVYGQAELAVALFDEDTHWLGRHITVGSGGKAGEWTRIEGEITVDDPEAASFDLEVVALEDRVFVDDVGVWRL